MRSLRKDHIFLCCIALVIVLILLVRQAPAETYKYNAQGRLTRVIYDDGSRISYIYDRAGNIIQCRMFTGAGTEYLSLTLYQGFNLFSIPYNLPETDVSVVLADIFYSIQSVFVLRGGIWYGAAPDHDTGMWDDEIGSIDGGETFVIYMINDDTLHVEGTPLVQRTVILNQGFNLAPYNSASVKTVEEAFGGIRDYVQAIFVYDPVNYLWLGCAPDNGGWDTEFATLSPGVGIVIYCSADNVVWDVGQ